MHCMDITVGRSTSLQRSLMLPPASSNSCPCESPRMGTQGLIPGSPSEAQESMGLQPSITSSDATAVSRKLLQRLNYENPNYHPSPPPPVPPPPPSPPPSPPSPPAGQGTVPWQGTLQGITSALGQFLTWPGPRMAYATSAHNSPSGCFCNVLPPCVYHAAGSLRLQTSVTGVHARM